MNAPGSDLLLERLMTLHPKIIDLTLDRVWRLLATLDHPERRLPPVVHIAGTNGKGSTLAMIRAGLEGAGQTCHAYTSPHLARFHERIRLAGELISEPDLAALLAECETANGGAPITYFEITTVAALLAFARTPADWTLLEVGLGGRLDATNVIDTPALCVITPVSYDHQQFLGDTLPEIAGEKAGILKRGVTCVVGPQQDAALEVIEDRAARVGAPLRAHGQHWHVSVEHERLVYQDETGLLDLPLPVLPGPHQIENAGMALAALRALGTGDPEPALTKAQWPARMQRLRHGPLVELAPEVELWLDGGHNPAAGLALAATLAGLPERPTYLICGMLKTKDVAGFLRPLAARAKALHAVSIPGEAATLTAAETAAHAAALGLPSLQAANVAAALAQIAAEDPGARVVICGSLYLAGAVLRENG
ncbi:folylpolyglutamate synthase [Dinoroseobacter shibae DFL 12 = DSM 16493]|uniref:Dihydrofolate synthase/folylpolyglutamate synthase n=1 Tax=Dinoroseobacter shibae (strain DSM 16493 / NCIMB 14021 / DFL 12) TaxID=398580 RepID=A8LKN8_DINSH|nr:folylpolyglutamate synthase/dihydrofolate synthase family protein [Dinoroseobacter shibae]ABV91881.1 folylpolyglutamate synthase [Dinoroseobacter shibae DFL 12 = DSM 16493]URF46859.1 bifunctional folylpolyglutamate synthase/dihydrofolate synthase [Dinoroseobacter shibae]URF51170.1 bifunctional folylpolyglutamate synthase/dihydrofolate synthase [Dinoroseobacter shibae]